MATGTRVDAKRPFLCQRRTASGVAAVGITVAAALVAACSDLPSAPGRSISLAARQALNPPPTGADIPVPQTNWDPPIVDDSTGVYLPDNSTVVIHVVGVVHLEETPGYGLLNSHGTLQGGAPYAGSDIGPLGVTGGYVKVGIKLIPSNFGPSLVADPSQASAAVTDTIRLIAGQRLLVSRKLNRPGFTGGSHL